MSEEIESKPTVIIEELPLPCLLCKSTEVYLRDDMGCEIHCNRCGLNLVTWDPLSREEIVKMWNTRPQSEALPELERVTAQRDRLLKALGDHEADVSFDTHNDDAHVTLWQVFGEVFAEARAKEKQNDRNN